MGSAVGGELSLRSSASRTTRTPPGAPSPSAGTRSRSAPSSRWPDRVPDILNAVLVLVLVTVTVTVPRPSWGGGFTESGRCAWGDRSGAPCHNLWDGYRGTGPAAYRRPMGFLHFLHGAGPSLGGVDRLATRGRAVQGARAGLGHGGGFQLVRRHAGRHPLQHPHAGGPLRRLPGFGIRRAGVAGRVRRRSGRRGPPPAPGPDRGLRAPRRAWLQGFRRPVRPGRARRPRRSPAGRPGRDLRPGEASRRAAFPGRRAHPTESPERPPRAVLPRFPGRRGVAGRKTWPPGCERWDFGELSGSRTSPGWMPWTSSFLPGS